MTPKLAVQCWCDDRTKDTVMDTVLATVFAKMLQELMDVREVVEPEPAVEPEEPKRRLRYIQPQPSLHCDVAFEKEQQAGPIGYWSLEHRSNDLDPYACREVLKEMDDLQCGWCDKHGVQIDMIRQWITKLRRTNDDA